MGPARVDQAGKGGVADGPGARFVGRTVGNYTLDSVLGQGGMGLVLAGRHRFLGDPVAVKLLHGPLAADPAIARRFFQEAKVTRTVEHPHIVRLLDFGQDESTGTLYLVMERLEGAPLSRLIARQALGELDAVRVAAAVSDGLSVAHAKGVVHRDLKPDNVFLCRDGKVKILDFGIAKLATLDQTTTGLVLGTPHYMAPEQATGSKQIGPWTDIYALGCMTFKMLTGRLPFRADDPTQLVAMHIHAQPPRPSEMVEVSPAVEQLVLDCLEKEPSRRPPSMGAVRERLGEVLARAGQPRELTLRPELVQAVLEPVSVPPPAAPTDATPAVAAHPSAATGGGAAKGGAPEAATRGATPKSRDRQRAGEGPTRGEVGGGAGSGGTTQRRSGRRATWVLAVTAPLAILGALGAWGLARRASSTDAVPPAGAAATEASDAALPELVKSTAGTALGHVTVESDPPGAIVYVAGSRRGPAPIALDLTLPTAIELQLHGHRRERLTVREAGLVHVTLQPEPKRAKSAISAAAIEDN